MNIKSIPDNILAEILSYLTPLEHFQAVPAVSKQLRRVARLETAWSKAWFGLPHRTEQGETIAREECKEEKCKSWAPHLVRWEISVASWELVCSIGFSAMDLHTVALPDGLSFGFNLLPSLRSLNLRGCNDFVNDATLSTLKGAPLEYLNLSYCSQITNAGLHHLSEMLLQYINLTWCFLITDAGLANFVNMPLRHLILDNCENITHGLQFLSTRPLQELSLENCIQIRDEDLFYLKNISIRRLNLNNCYQITNAGLRFLLGMPLQHLELCNCFQITDTGLRSFSGMDLQHLNPTNCYEITRS